MIMSIYIYNIINHTITIVSYIVGYDQKVIIIPCKSVVLSHNDTPNAHLIIPT